MINSREGAAENGLIYGFTLDGRGGGRELSLADAADPANSQSLQWIHLDFTEHGAQQWLRDRSNLDRIIVDALLDEDSRPHMLEHEKGLLVILRGVNSNPGADPEDMVSIRVWLEPNRIISTRRRKLLSVQSLVDALRKGTGPVSSGDFLVSLVRGLGDLIEPAVEKLDLKIEEAENRFEGNQSMVYGSAFTDLRRQSARIRRYLSPQRDALERISRLTNSVLSANQCNSLREEANQITRNLEDLDLVRERAMVSQEELLAYMANQQNSRIYILSLVAAIFLPLSFITGMMGMNVAGLPGTENPLAFLILAGLMTVAAIGIVGLFKWKKWL